MEPILTFLTSDSFSYTVDSTVAFRAGFKITFRDLIDDLLL